jgi:hypothetical protein
MGSSFYSGWLIPRETSLVIWGSERSKGLKDQDDGFLSQITAKWIVKEKVIPLIKAPVCETRQIKLKCAAVVSTSNLMTILNIYEQ